MTTTATITASSSSASRAGLMEEVLIVVGLIGVQIVYAFYVLFLHNFLSLGVNSLFLITFAGLASSLLLLPFALVLEKKKWPERLRPVLMIQLLLVAVAGVAFQVLMMLGIKMTSPAISSAMPNLAPVFIFVIAACFRFEKFSIWCNYSRAKVLGTITCLAGATAMSFLMSPPSAPDSTTERMSAIFLGNNLLFSSVSSEWILGCLYLLCAVILLSCMTVLQAATMVSFQAPLSLCAVTTLMGSIFTAITQFVMEGDLNVGSSSLELESIVALVLLGGIVSSVCIGYQTWCINKKGPVMVSIFNPAQTVFSAILSALILGQIISLGSLAGMMLMFVGLYVVLWAKNKEDTDVIFEADHDIEKPLLS